MEWHIRIVDVNAFQKFTLGLDKKTQAKLARIMLTRI